MPKRVRNPITEAKRLKGLLDEGFTRKEVAESEKIGRTALDRRLALLRLCPEVAELAEDGTLKFGTAYKLSMYDRAEDQIRKVQEWGKTTRYVETMNRLAESLSQLTGLGDSKVESNGQHHETPAGNSDTRTVERGVSTGPSMDYVTMDDIRDLKNRAIYRGQKRYALALARMEVILALEESK